MRNSDFIKRVIHCRDCIHRHTNNCPMYFEVQIGPRYMDSVEYDNTADDCFCSWGEKNEE